MEIKLIAFDLDDTLLNDKVKISKENLESLAKINKKGINIVLCSGRPKFAMMTSIKQISEYCKANYSVAFNGAAIFDQKQDNFFASYLSKSDIDKLIDISREWEISLQLYHDSEMFVENYNEYTKSYMSKTEMNLSVINDLKDINKSYKALFNTKAGKKLDNLRKHLIEEFPNLNVFYSKPEYVELIDKNSSKGNAIKKIAEILNIKKSEIICVGDGLNDLSMIEYAGIGIAMRNGNSALKDLADYVTEYSNNEPVVNEIYEKFIK